MKFKYAKFFLPERSPLFGTAIARPIISIAILHSGNKVHCPALVDSGADLCIFDAAVGNQLGIDVERGVEGTFTGVQATEPSRVFMHEIALGVGGWNHKTTIGFSYDVGRYGYGILGQRGFFDIFVVRFDLLKEEIELKERK